MQSIKSVLILLFLFSNFLHANLPTPNTIEKQLNEYKQDYYSGTKKFVNDPKNKDNVEILRNSNATQSQKEQALTSLSNYLTDEMGLDAGEVKLMLDKSYQGFTSEQTNKMYVADNINDTSSDMVNSVGNETSDYADLTRDKGVVKTKNYKNNRTDTRC